MMDDSVEISMHTQGVGGASRRVGDVLLGRYEILSELGRGGMGVVWKCFDRTGGMEVAIKELPQELSHSAVEMETVRENFQLVAKLVHQNIALCRMLEQDPGTGDYFLVMDVASGEDLRRLVRREKKLPLERVVRLLGQVADALDYAHGEGVAHRDIKPANLMAGVGDRVKVLDFGLAAQIRSSMSRVSMNRQETSGTAAYMAPEQWRGRHVDGAADQYALAATAYELLAGYPPFEGDGIAVLREAVLKEAPARIAGLPEDAWAALARALAKEPGERFASCGEFIAALGGRDSRDSRDSRDEQGELLRLQGWLNVHRGQIAAIVDREGGFGAHLDGYAEAMETGRLALAGHSPAHAVAAFRKAKEEAEWLLANEPSRKRAQQARKAMDAARRQAQAAHAETDAAALFQEGEGAAAGGEAAFALQRFSEAAGGWEAAEAAFRQAAAEAGRSHASAFAKPAGTDAPKKLGCLYVLLAIFPLTGALGIHDLYAKRYVRFLLHVGVWFAGCFWVYAFLISWIWAIFEAIDRS